MNRKERILSVLKGLVMAAAGIFLLMVENMWFREQKSGVTGSIRIEGLLVITGLALLVLGVAFIRDGCRRKKTSTRYNKSGAENIFHKRGCIDCVPLLRRQCTGKRTDLPDMWKRYV